MENYHASDTGIILIDPYNDFISEGGKLWDLVKQVAVGQNTVTHMKEIIQAARAKGLQIFYVPHKRWEPENFSGWKYPTPYQLKTAEFKVFEKDKWGGQFHPDFAPKKGDVLIKEHWSSNGFANTDLDQQLKQHGISRVIVIGLLANTCAESTAKGAQELGYEVTLVKDATAAYSFEAMKAAHDLNGPTYAHHIFTTKELLPLFS